MVDHKSSLCKCLFLPITSLLLYQQSLYYPNGNETLISGFYSYNLFSLYQIRYKLLVTSFSASPRSILYCVIFFAHCQYLNVVNISVLFLNILKCLYYFRRVSFIISGLHFNNYMSCFSDTSSQMIGLELDIKTNSGTTNERPYTAAC